VEQNRRYPKSFWIPSDASKAMVGPGDTVKVFFAMKDGWGERMWVEVKAVKRRHIVGALSNQPVGIPRLWNGDTIKFKAEHIIDIWTDGIIEEDEAEI
jgi:uncharacterized protein YegJ (DUF2314 family)